MDNDEEMIQKILEMLTKARPIEKPFKKKC
jgi:hypothetical protein